MVARTLDESVVYRKSLTACAAISAMLERTRVRSDFDLRSQLAASSGAVPANIAEGFGQQSDRRFARYLFIARGSAHEVRAHLSVAHARKYLESADVSELGGKYDEIARMLTGLIRYLLASDR